MNTNKLIGKKVKGFKFDDGMHKGLEYVSDMNRQIGKIGKIIAYRNSDNSYHVEFEDDYWFYPAELIEQHLVEETPLDDLPIIGDGVLMEVSVDGITWDARNVIGMTKENKIIAHVDGGMLSYGFWKHARPITPKTKITRKEFESKFEIID
jgi:hypothetical protein